jgi:hypothetical protein
MLVMSAQCATRLDGTSGSHKSSHSFLSGLVSPFPALLQSLLLRLPAAEFDALFDAVIVDGSGSLDAAEFTAAMRELGVRARGRGRPVCGAGRGEMRLLGLLHASA